MFCLRGQGKSFDSSISKIVEINVKNVKSTNTKILFINFRLNINKSI